MGKQSVARRLVDTLAAAGVERIYGLAGHSLDGVTYAIRRRSAIHRLPARHEEVARARVTPATAAQSTAGLLEITVETPEAMRPAIQRALDHDRPALVEVRLARRELSIPPTAQMDQAVGFTLFMLRAVLSGRGDELVDLAKTNLLR
jgi:thiamine pyrophosphate-dependent acetolactate synthase large subunit-like protein